MQRFLGYLWNPLSWAMEVAAILAIILLDYADFALIVALLLLNATISFVEESNADKAIKALTSALAPKCKVRRSTRSSRGGIGARTLAVCAHYACHLIAILRLQFLLTHACTSVKPACFQAL